jgi:enediyne biosynthesis protein E4
VAKLAKADEPHRADNIGLRYTEDMRAKKPIAFFTLSALLLLGSACPKGKEPGGTAAPPETTAGIRFAELPALAYKWEIAGSRPLNILKTIGNGCALFDFDNDGNLDALLVGPKTALFKGDGKGGFADVSTAWGLSGLKNHLGCAVGDFDSDGYPDVYLTAYRGGALLHNDRGKKFTDVGKAWGLPPQPWTTAAAFVDTDLDGKLDLYIGSYADFGPDKDQLCPQQGIPTSCGPRHYTPIPGTLYKNTGGKFMAQPIKDSTGRCLGIAAAPLDETRRPTLALANDEIPGDLLSPEGSGFKNTATLAGTAYDRDGNVHGGMGTDWGDFDNDGKLDLFVATFQNEVKCLYKNEGDGIFTEVAIPTQLASTTRPWVAFGCGFADFDNDGWLDLAIANGHVQDNIQQIEKDMPYRQKTQLLRNNAGKFEDVSTQAGAAFQKDIVGRGLATGDIDNDGRLDLLVVDSEGAPLLLKNEGEKPGHWLGLRLLTRGRDAYGALVAVTVGGKKRVLHCHADGSYMSASDPRVHVGLGAAAKPDAVEITWPSGKKTTLTDLPVDAYTTVSEEKGLQP